eukprot:Seg2656.5 transcript_id=Seg2656.5/GoldUCD/mRNA.D3Y31 product="hypothetical protein" protein_id=Seg2656.5/GoldUCD/D3Y31
MEGTAPEVDGAVATIVENANLEVLLSEQVNEDSADASVQGINPISAGDLDVESDHGVKDEVLEETGLSQEEQQQEQATDQSEATATAGTTTRQYPDPKIWKPYIKSLLASGVRGLHIIPTPLYDGRTCPKVEDYLTPDIYIWDTKYENPSLDGHCCFEETCSSKVAFYPMKGAFSIRWLYDYEKPLLLVTSIAYCKGPEQHRFLGYDPRVLKCFPDPESVPFVLFHICGLTRGMLNSLMSQASSGVKFGVVHNNLKDRYSKNHEEKKAAYLKAMSSYKEDHPGSQATAKFPEMKVKGPRESFFRQCFLLSFKDKEYFYKLSMSQLLADEWIKVDPDPKNPKINKKAKEKPRIFMCQNEVGQVLSWKLTEIETYDEIKEILVSVKERHEQVGRALKGCSTSLCCEWREGLQSTFGKEFKVKADIEQAVQRFSEALTVKGVPFSECVAEFRSVFQGPEDDKEKRMQATPSSDVIMKNIEKFKGKWSKIADEKHKVVLSYPCTLVLNDIQEHILKGCYSEIEPLPNDISLREFHSSLKKKVHNCRGMPATIAITTIAIHEHNTERQKELGRDTAPVLVVVPGETEQEGAVSLGVGNLKCLTIEVDINKTLERIASNQTKQSVDPGSMLESTIVFLDKKKQDLLTQMAEHCLNESIIKKAMVFFMFNDTIEKNAPNGIVAPRLIPFLSCAFPLLLQQNVEKLTSSDKKAVDDELEKFKGLQTMWKKDQRKFEPEITTEEDEFLYTVAVILECYLSSSIASNEEGSEVKSYQEFLVSQDFDVGMRASEIVTKLRHMVAGKISVAKEEKGVSSQHNVCDGGKGRWQDSATYDGNDSQQQQMEVQYSAAAEREHGYPTMSGESSFGRIDKEQVSAEGNLEALAREIANVLSANVTIISDLAYFPVIPIFSQMISRWTPYLFIYCKRRNFVPIISKHVFSSEEQSANGTNTHGEEWTDGEDSGTESGVRDRGLDARCDCGRSNPSHILRCFEGGNSKSKTRCRCFRANRKCTVRCTCRNCRNPLGARVWVRKRFRKNTRDPTAVPPEPKKAKESNPPETRRRNSHYLSVKLKDMKASGDSKIPIEHGNWVGGFGLAEKFLLEALISEIRVEEDALTADIVTSKYNDVVKVATQIDGLKNMVYLKTSEQVNERLKEREKDVETYLSMYQKQLDLM